MSYNEEYIQHQPGNQNGDNTYRHVLADEDDSRAEPETPITATATSRKLINNPPADPAVARAANFLVEAIDALKEVPANCIVCGVFMDGRQKRFTLLTDTVAVVYCNPCFIEKNALPLQPVDGWQSKVTPQHLEIVDRRGRGETYAQIGAAMRLHRRKVSRMLDEVKAARTAAGNRRTS